MASKPCFDGIVASLLPIPFPLRIYVGDSIKALAIFQIPAMQRAVKHGVLTRRGLNAFNEDDSQAQKTPPRAMFFCLRGATKLTR